MKENAIPTMGTEETGHLIHTGSERVVGYGGFQMNVTEGV